MMQWHTETMEYKNTVNNNYGSVMDKRKQHYYEDIVTLESLGGFKL